MPRRASASCTPRRRRIASNTRSGSRAHGGGQRSRHDPGQRERAVELRQRSGERGGGPLEPQGQRRASASASSCHGLPARVRGQRAAARRTPRRPRARSSRDRRSTRAAAGSRRARRSGRARNRARRSTNVRTRSSNSARAGVGLRASWRCRCGSRPRARPRTRGARRPVRVRACGRPGSATPWPSSALQSSPHGAAVVAAPRASRRTRASRRRPAPRAGRGCRGRACRTGTRVRSPRRGSASTARACGSSPSASRERLLPQRPRAVGALLGERRPTCGSSRARRRSGCGRARPRARRRGGWSTRRRPRSRCPPASQQS